MLTPARLRSLGLLLCGFLFGSVFSVAMLGRYTIRTAAAGQPAIIHCYRLDKISGEVIGIGSVGAYGAQSIPAWFTAPIDAPNPYLDAK